MSEEIWERYQRALNRLQSDLPWEPEFYQFGEEAQFNRQFEQAFIALEALAELVHHAAETLDSLTIIGWAAIASTLGVSKRHAMRWRLDLKRAGVILRYDKIGNNPQEKPVASYLRLIAFKMSRDSSSKK